MTGSIHNDIAAIMIRHILSLLIAVFATVTAYADANWRMHTSFDGKIDHLVDTRYITYFTSQAMPEVEGRDTYLTLFKYDKKGDELINLSTDNILSGNTIHTVQYNPNKKYLMVIYSDYDIDLLYDNGKVVNIPTYKLSSVSGKKNVNSITPDHKNNRMYIATDFGYVALNDDKHEIAESRIYGEPFKSVARMEDYLVVLHGNDLLRAPLSSQRLSFSDFEKVAEFEDAKMLAPLGEGKLLLFEGTKGDQHIKLLRTLGDNIEIVDLLDGMFYNVEYNTNGVTVPSGAVLYQIRLDGTYTYVPRPEEDWRISAASYNMRDIWHAKQRAGIKNGNYNAGVWTSKGDYISPNAPAPFIATDMLMHPTRGLMITNYGNDALLDGSFDHDTPMLLSAYKDGRWTNLAPIYTYPEQGGILRSPNGFAIDPDNPDIIYFTSEYYGMVRLDLKDPSNVIHLSRPGDPYNNLPGFVVVFGDQTVANRKAAHFSRPVFDYFGNLWMTHADYDNQEQLNFYCWTKEDRKATTSASNIALPKKLVVKGFKSSFIEDILPMQYQGNRNILIHYNSNWDGEIVIVDTANTPLEGSDDTVTSITSFVDQDGNVIDVHNIRCAWEDPLTGNVWVGHRSGVFYFNPRDILRGANNVFRVKVSRNDGTNLADYLLNEVSVNKIISDGNGKKWFATSGGGLVCTSADGKTIEKQITSESTPLPDDFIYGVAYNRDNNSLMISTGKGLAEYFMNGNVEENEPEETGFKIYPNPVRPEFLGHVTIEGLPSGSLVKITDVAGNIVKELGKTAGTSAQWDMTNHQYKRVATGVYFILVSTDHSDSSFSNVGQVLVVN